MEQIFAMSNSRRMSPKVPRNIQAICSIRKLGLVLDVAPIQMVKSQTVRNLMLGFCGGALDTYPS